MSKLTINNYDDLQLKCISIMKEIQTNVTSYFEEYDLHKIVKELRSGKKARPFFYF